MKLLARLLLPPTGPARQENHQQNGSHKGGQHHAETGFENRGRHIEAPVTQKYRGAEFQTLTRPRQGLQHREIPEHDLQQQRDVTKGLHIDSGEAGNQPVAGEAGHPHEKTDNGRENDA